MSGGPTFEDIFRVMAAASVGDEAARVDVPADAPPDEVPTRFAIALNLLLDELAFRAERQRRGASAERAANEALDASQIRNAAIVRTALDAIVGMDGAGLVNEWNPAAERTFGFARSEVLGRPLDELIIPPDARAAHRGGMARYRATGHGPVLGRRLELTAIRRDGVELPIELSIAAIDGPEPAFIGSIRDITERRRAEDALRASEKRYRTMFEESPIPMIVFDTETRSIVDVNTAALEQYGHAREAFEAMRIDDLVVAIDPDEDEPPGLPKTEARPARHRKRDGTLVDVEERTLDMELAGRPTRLVMAHDVTERRRLEAQLQQAQKMEAVGRLAGGVAHDFNNLLSVILGYGEAMMTSLRPSDPLKDDVAEICRAGERAAVLTRQLLTFSRQKAVEPKVLDLNRVLAGMNRMLERAAGIDVRVHFRLAEPLGTVRIDLGGIEQVVMNLVVNARDAMPNGGEIVLETGDVFLDEAYAQAHLGVTPGPHVMLAIRDTGAGMDKATQARIFEPFFTTKAPGKGTGLGLSVVFGIVRQSGGSIWVYSEVGRGTVFKIFFPRVELEADALGPARPTKAPGGTETILLVEDDEQVRRLTHGILESAGYVVFAARDGFEALAIADGHPERIHLLLSDVVMPTMTGPELARRLVAARPGLRVLCVSGYTDDVVLEQADARIAFLQKPVTPETLKLKVREVLDGVD
jgi:PAS domain S-box-containing protein